MKEKLTKKEKLFCRYFSLTRNAREAAALSGYVLASLAGNKLLEQPAIRKEIERVSKNYPDKNEIEYGFRRLAFGSVADCVKLLFKEDVSENDIEAMDLFNISEIKRPKNGGIEIKFFDRLKALELLEEINCSDNNSSAAPFYDAIRKGAAALKPADENA